jgi:hypothetical protein
MYWHVLSFVNAETKGRSKQWMYIHSQIDGKVETNVIREKADVSYFLDQTENRDNIGIRATRKYSIIRST